MKEKAIFRCFLAILLLVSVPLCAQNHEANRSHFAWGLDLGSSIDLTGNSMTAVDIDGVFGYRNSLFSIIGVGAGVNMVMSNSTRCFPIFATLRTSFTKRKSILFLDIRGGYSFNDIDNYSKQGGLYGRIGVGVNLARGKTWSSHFLVGYSFYDHKDFSFEEKIIPCPDIHLASLGIGISF